MADFRKWFMVVAVVLAAAAAANASQSTLTCQSIGATPTVLRTGGVTEYIGEIDLQCDTTSLTGTAVFTNFTLAVNTVITNAVTTGNVSMAGVIVQYQDAPKVVYSATQGIVSQVATPACPSGCYNALFYPNVAMPTGTLITIRFVNVRVAALSSTVYNAPTNSFGVTEIVALVAGQATTNAGVNVAGSSQIPQGLVVALIQPTMNFNVTSCTGSAAPTIALQQCVDYTLNSGTFLGHEPAPVFGVTFTETPYNKWAFRNVTDEDGQTIPTELAGGTYFFTPAPASPAAQTVICDTNHQGIGSEITGITTDPYPPTPGAPPCTPAAWVSQGTRLVATFNLDPRLVGKVTVWVSEYQTNSISGAAATLATTTSLTGGGPKDYTPSGNLVACANNTNGAASNYWVALPTTGATAGTPTAAWEVTAENGAQVDDLTFAIAITYAEDALESGVAYNPITIAGTIGPIDLTTPGPYVLSVTEPVVRFDLPPILGPVPITIDHCVTNLLYPYVTDVYVYETGVAIANTSLDTAWNLNPPASWPAVWGTATAPLPYNTTPQAGTCNLYLFGSVGAVTMKTTTPNPVVAIGATTPAIAAGSEFADTVSDIFGLTQGSAAAETGYVIARCQFQFAHGYAYVMDTAAGQTTAQSYLALVIPDRNIFNPQASPTFTPIRIAQPFSNAIYDEQGEILSQ